MAGVSRNILIIAGGILAIALVIVILLAIQRTGDGRGFIPAPVGSNRSDREVESDETADMIRPSDKRRNVDSEALMKTMSAPTDNSVCGNRICDRSESIATCFTDCVDRSVFDDIRFNRSGDDFRVIWSTAYPMTSEAIIGTSTGTYEAGKYMDSSLKTEHVANFTGLDDSVVYFVKLSGQDASGRASSIEGYGDVFE